MKRTSVILLCVLLAAGCSKTDNNQDSLHKEYVNMIYSALKAFVDMNNDVFTTQFFIDAQGDELKLNQLDSMYWSRNDLEYSAETGILTDCYQSAYLLNIDTGGKSIISDHPVEWKVDGLYNNLWGGEQEKFSYGIARESGGDFSIKGRLLSNRLWEEAYFYNDFDLTAEVDSVKSNIYYGHGNSQKTIFTFNMSGDFNIKIGNADIQDSTMPSFSLKVDGLYGCDCKFYIDGEPLYDGDTYFVAGTISGNVLTPDGKTDTIEITISEDKVWTVLYNGEPL